MSDIPETPQTEDKEQSLFFFRNWISMTGVICAVSALFAFFLLFAIEILTHGSNAYLGILTFLVAPAFLILGIIMIIGGGLVMRWQKKRGQSIDSPLSVSFDLKRPKDRRYFMIFSVSGVMFLLLSALGSYKTYHFTESVQFCGQVCHEVMEPEYTAFLQSPHARIDCAECHIGSGATWYVKAKISGLYQVYSTIFNKYHRPIETPIANLRPAQETCEQCHWPQKFVGNMERTYNHYLSDDENTPFTVRMLLKVGGGDPTQGPVGGIHWHMNVGNKIEYITTDEKHQEIPWVRMTNHQGVVTVYKTEEFEDDPENHEIHHMDCMDCHNRPAHIFQTPNDAVELAMSLGKIDRTLSEIKFNAVDALTSEYETLDEAQKGIATKLFETYRDESDLEGTIAEVQRIYKANFFPGMKVRWDVYPDNIGHKNWPGCFRCHDGEHHSTNQTLDIKADDCNACHTILAQGRGDELRQLAPEGLEFAHPDGDVEGFLCTDCHTGGLQ